MIRKMYSVRDAKTEIFDRSFPAHTHGEAERMFKDVVNQKETAFGKNPEDFDLYYLGDFDDNTGKFTCPDTPTHIVKAIQLVQ